MSKRGVRIISAAVFLFLCAFGLPMISARTEAQPNRSPGAAVMAKPQVGGAATSTNLGEQTSVRSHILVAPAQRPAPEVEAEINKFQGQREPGFSPIEWSVHPRNGEWILDAVDPNSDLAKKNYRPGDVLNPIDIDRPTPSAPTTNEH